MDESLYELPQECDFTAVWNNSGQEFDCSPKLKDPFFSPFQGILINAPAEVAWPAGADPADYERSPDGNSFGPVKLMVAGLLRLPYSTLGLKGDRAGSVRIIAVDRNSAATFVGTMEVMGSEFDAIRPDLPDSEPSDLPTTEYFNIDLVANLDIPVANASYNVYATLGEYKSNTVVVSTRVE